MKKKITLFLILTLILILLFSFFIKKKYSNNNINNNLNIENELLEKNQITDENLLNNNICDEGLIYDEKLKDCINIIEKNTDNLLDKKTDLVSYFKKNYYEKIIIFDDKNYLGSYRTELLDGIQECINYKDKELELYIKEVLVPINNDLVYDFYLNKGNDICTNSSRDILDEESDFICTDYKELFNNSGMFMVGKLSSTKYLNYLENIAIKEEKNRIEDGQENSYGFYIRNFMAEKLKGNILDENSCFDLYNRIKIN